jgi:BASS family bile acid:Na+ symporter
MDTHPGALARAAHFAQRHFLVLLLASYAAAAALPGPGLWLRGARLGGTSVSAPGALLALLLFNAGLGVEAGRLGALFRSPLALIAGLVANLAVPLLFLLALSQTLRLWHNPDEVQHILVGLALVASMPVAGSSAAWSQNAGGDLALSLGLVVFSTCLSPLTTPAALHAAGWMADGLYADSLHRLAAAGTGSFLAAYVLVPTLAGLGLGGALGPRRLARARPALRLANSAALLLLIYANAAAALPDSVFHPDWDFLAVMLTVVVTLCVLGFAAGRALAWALRADGPRQASLVFALGMNNNGTGLVLASSGLAHLPSVLLPVIFYNLVQHLIAGVADVMGRRRRLTS